MKHSGRKSAQDALAAALVAGATVQAAADAAGVGRVTAHRWLRDPTFQAKVAELRREATQQAVNKLVAALMQAVAELQNLAASPTESIRLRACVTLLDHGLKAAALADLEDRIRSLEQKLTDANIARPLE
jgi:transposase-like protein